MKYLYLYPANLNLFDANTNVTTDTGLTEEMKTYYSDYLIDMAQPNLVHEQFGQKHPIPQNGGKIIQFRKFDPLPKMTTALQEGVTPDGQKLTMGTVSATVSQYGGFLELSDMLLLTAIDNNLVQATELLGSQAGRTLDTLTREVLVGGTNVQYAEGQVSSRHELVGGSSTAADNHYLTVDAIRRAVRFLKKMNAPKLNGSYVGIIHPDCSYDLMNDSKWVNVKTYSDPEGIYEGEIGKIEGVRFVESSEAKMWHAEDLLKATADGETASRTLTVKTALSEASATVAVKEAVSAAQATALAGRKVLIGDEIYTVQSAASGAAGSATVTLNKTLTVSANASIYPGEAGAAGRDVYATLILGGNAYGVTEITGGGLQHIVKQLGSSGTADPLDQRATAGWKATRATERLVEAYMVRVESTSTFNTEE